MFKSPITNLLAKRQPAQNSVRSYSSAANNNHQSSSSCLEKYVEHLHQSGAYNLTSLREERRVADGRRLIKRHILGIWTSVLILASVTALIVYGVMFSSTERSQIRASTERYWPSDRLGFTQETGNYGYLDEAYRTVHIRKNSSPNKMTSPQNDSDVRA